MTTFEKMMLVILFIIIIFIAICCALYKPKSVTGAGEGFVGGGSFRFKVSDPEYTSMLEKKKTLEVRLDRPPFNRLKEQDEVVIVRSRPMGDTSEYPGGKYKFDAQIVSVKKHTGGIEKLMNDDSVRLKAYPDSKNAADAVKRFNAYLPPDTAKDSPLLIFNLQHITKKKHVHT